MLTKKHTATLLILMSVGLTGLVHGQMTTTIKAQVPFDFVANGETMPAGECTIQIRVNGQTLLSVSSGKQHVFSFTNANDSNASKETVLVFHKYRDRYFLAGINRAKEVGYVLPSSRLEGELWARNALEEVFILASAK